MSYFAWKAIKKKKKTQEKIGATKDFFSSQKNNEYLRILKTSIDVCYIRKYGLD